MCRLSASCQTVLMPEFSLDCSNHKRNNKNITFCLRRNIFWNLYFQFYFESGEEWTILQMITKWNENRIFDITSWCEWERHQQSTKSESWTSAEKEPQSIWSSPWVRGQLNCLKDNKENKCKHQEKVKT